MSGLASGLPEIVGDDEDIARFLTQSSHFSTTTAKPNAFLPSPRDRETSVSRHGRNPAAELWALGEAAAGQRKLYGAAILKARDIRSAHSVRATYALDERTARRIEALARSWGVSQAEVIRRSVQQAAEQEAGAGLSPAEVVARYAAGRLPRPAAQTRKLIQSLRRQRRDNDALREAAGD